MEIQSKKYYIQYLMSLVGGIFGAYAILNFKNSFGSAQTANLIYLIMDLIGNNIGEFLIRALACLIYIAGIVSGVVLLKFDKINLKMWSVIIDIIAVILLLLLPTGYHDVVSLYPIFFATALQWCVFNEVDGYVSSCIFSTNNLRQFVTAGTDYIYHKKRQDLLKMKFFGLVLISYHIGVAVSFFAYIQWGREGIVICLLPLMIAIVLIGLKTARKGNDGEGISVINKQ